MNALLTALLTITTVSATPTATPTKPYFIEMASKGLVRYALQHTVSGANEKQASSVAGEIVDSLLSPPQATKILHGAASYYVMNGPTMAATDASKLATQASKFYNSLHTQPVYESFISNVGQQTTLFDVEGAFNQLQDKIASLGQVHSSRATEVAGQIDQLYSSLKAQPAGAAAIETGRGILKEVGKDFDIDTKKFKQKMDDAKANILNAINQ
ncbi:hypothetical protein DASB73_035090 [Starmerella bacillaris]|uniref:Uncharacterized protein n=1 Tax=Starmerella bacillaris TaxID=1247836 RepID=A0AAV5RLZ0_STABA|nr:hypothetical protein DASB73_035090 [Starmerella bacillaris]